MIIEDEVVYTSEYIDKLYHDEFDQIVELAISEGYVTATKEKYLFKLFILILWEDYLAAPDFLSESLDSLLRSKVF